MNSSHYALFDAIINPTSRQRVRMRKRMSFCYATEEMFVPSPTLPPTQLSGNNCIVLTSSFEVPVA